MANRVPSSTTDQAGRASGTDWRAPMLATLTDRRFSDLGWLYERKLDGIRAIGTSAGHLWSRNQQRMEHKYPELREALLTRGPRRFIADGEIVAFDGNRTSFAKLQGRSQLARVEEIERSGIAVRLYLFDLLMVDDEDLTNLPLRDRKRLLRAAFDFGDELRFTAHRNADGEGYYQHACARGWEGVIAKRATSPYRPGRSTDWLKWKCSQGQEFVIGGYTDPGGSRVGFGALLLGYYEHNLLRYAGKVGTGFDHATLRALHTRLAELSAADRPFADEVREAKAHWVRPELVAQIEFSEWTTDGRLRHPRFTGLRTDKPARSVVRERPT